jgi:hypothetical protein
MTIRAVAGTRIDWAIGCSRSRSNDGAQGAGQQLQGPVGEVAELGVRRHRRARAAMFMW